MKKMLLGVALCFGLATAHAQVFSFGLNSTNDLGGFLSGAFEVPVNSSTATAGEVGVGISYDNTTQTLNFNLAYGLFGFEPLTADYLSSHLHIAGAGTNGPVAINLESIRTGVGTRAGFYSGDLTLTPTQEQALFNSLMYVNIHSTTFPGGEIRAQLIPTSVPEPSVLALAGFGIAALIIMRRR